ncbi:non-hydrolyzing UDP-N-acetylglucosamine 2-epimerase [Gracilimonas sediminicola]|uniref:UDP-N-acetylglucosamine 2-epimerase (non-hydrolyzing) n=1 Tax=Gracilimonas sediminicola TaxID=2952158 RepID=A0A9X2L752_9BACT|nr:UDP-N-acetylglucosamine 2-epimerase (non-hydrolyzing) [Gracilimonas sediminicola]MCP9292788.1 UDP-N-acetylglucosamine 2-epimerase (non-hydrolyzing) [Gracilimonas sediminicola]
MKKILIAFGTRPEVIKLAPVILELRESLNVTVLHTGQHKELVDPMLSLFDIQPDINLDIMKPNQDLFELTQSLLPKLKKVIEEIEPDFVMIQGDTTTSYLTALSSYYQKIPVLHVEAGLRSHNPYYPFPEEMNRRQITHLTHIHFAPTELNKKNLLKEGITEEAISVTGNTVIDALNSITKSKAFDHSAPDILYDVDDNQKLLVLTAHRRENHGKPLVNVFTAVKQLLASNDDLIVIFPAHPNPNVLAAIEQVEIKDERFKRTSPFDYLTFLHVLRRADLILTDSGGIQEEASALGKPVLVLRNETERQELIESGLGKLVGTDQKTIISEANAWLQSDNYPNASSVFGKGNAAAIIKEVIENQL